MKSKVEAKNGCDGRLMAKLFNDNDNSGNFVLPPPSSLGSGTKLTLYFTITLLLQPFLGYRLGFHIFYHPGYFWRPHQFYSLSVFGLDITSFLPMNNLTHWMILKVKIAWQ